MSRYCSECGKARKACLCPSIVALESAVELIILQHPTEQKRPLGTARILSLSLANCRLLVGEDFREHDELNQLLAEPDVDHYVLYPNEQAQECTEISLTTACKKRVILLDGTWKKAYKMWQINTQLHDLPSLRLSAECVGHYRIRKAPDDKALSTVEAGYHLLQQWQPERDFSPLLKVFDAMIQYQIDQMPEGVFERNYCQ
ncbi:DTW domain-containing protein [Vibrio cholerae]|uniref:tRNA-uridine aminocarboxypropyltransferase n=1 Tax=Vibrio cholerae TaxID=666 RepID=UPI00005F49D0|nr:tRNA-uridine aminocarboxypropyltransferase [Vibrio cholerae]EHU6504468.1 DTW domain-containing protein [Vibrio cholerae]EHY0952396.1 DTW domain-containing protein [Vibrio cholerae]EJL6906488.1 DTW domain-containing protein [Vibrio cholerae]EKF9159308.1 DTW domain-containing protein [Vibrio cholerae]EKF9790836.1 DTW domain-containing protein [Vibrio cholerae]